MKPILVILWLLALSFVTWQRVGVWRSNYTLWTSAVRVAPCSMRAHVNLAMASEGEQRLAEWRFAALLSIHEVPACD